MISRLTQAAIQYTCTRVAGAKFCGNSPDRSLTDKAPPASKKRPRQPPLITSEPGFTYQRKVENLLGGRHPGGEVDAVPVGEVSAEPHIEVIR